MVSYPVAGKPSDVVLGNLLAVTVHGVNIHDTVGGMDIYYKDIEVYSFIKGVSGDMGYRGTFVAHVSC